MTKDEYLRLVAEAQYHSDLYYNQDSPVLTDYEYDSRFGQTLKAVEAEHPDWVVATSPTQRVGGNATADLKKITHRIPLLSLRDVFSMEDAGEWFSGIGTPEVVVEQKIDGLTIALTYEDGVLVQGGTRGDGAVGEDVTENAKYIEHVPQALPLPKGIASHNTLIVRAEVYQPVCEFERVNAEMVNAGKKPFANPRNCAAGSLRTKDPLVTASRGLAAIAFTILFSDGWDNCPVVPGRTQSGDIALLNSLGFKGVWQTTCTSMKDVKKAIDDIGAVRNGTLPYWIDGAVVKVNDRSLQDKLGATVKCPKHAVAFKYPPEVKPTTVRQIAVQVGRTGVLTPVAKFDPIQLAGTTVTSATLHNQKFIKDNQVNIGSVIEVMKSGEIIPKVVGVPQPADTPFLITVCPECGEVAETSPEGISSCPNIDCPAQKARYFGYFCSKDVMDIDGMGPAMVDALINAGLLTDIVDLYYLHTHKAAIAVLDNLGEKSVQSLLTAIEKSKTQNIDRLIKALGIRGIGRHIGKALAAKYPDMEAIITLSEEALTRIDGVGDISAHDICRFFRSADGMARYQALKEAGVNTKSKTYGTTATGPLAGKTFVITGTLPSMGRDEAKALIEKHGGKTSSSVSKNTTYLLAGEAAGSKLDKANSLGVQVISEEELRGMLNEG